MEVTTLKKQAQIPGFAHRLFAERGIHYGSMATISLQCAQAARGMQTSL
jgi:hypothetical protein